MQKENNLTVGQWCGHWFTTNRQKWNGNTEGGYRNLIYSHIIPNIESVALSDLTEQAVTDFYDALRSQGLSARSIWCVHLLLRRCMDEAAQEQLIPYNPVRLCREPKTEEYKTAPLRLGQIQRYLNTAEQLGVLPIIYTGLSSGLRQCELITLSWADFHVRYKYILRGQRLLILNGKTVLLLEQIPETASSYVFLNPKTEAPYKLHEFYYLHKKILKRQGSRGWPFETYSASVWRWEYDASGIHHLLAGNLRQAPKQVDHLCSTQLCVQKPHSPRFGRHSTL